MKPQTLNKIETLLLIAHGEIPNLTPNRALNTLTDLLSRELRLTSIEANNLAQNLFNETILTKDLI